MNEKNKFSFGDVSRELSEMVENAKPAIEAFQKSIIESRTIFEERFASSREWVEGGVADSRKLAEDSVEKVNDIASTSVKLGKTTLAKLISNVPILGDRFPRDEE